MSALDEIFKGFDEVWEECNPDVVMQARADLAALRAELQAAKADNARLKAERDTVIDAAVKIVLQTIRYHGVRLTSSDSIIEYSVRDKITRALKGEMT